MAQVPRRERNQHSGIWRSGIAGASPSPSYQWDAGCHAGPGKVSQDLAMPGGRCLGTLATPGGCPGVQTQGEKRCGPFVLGVRPLASAPPPQEAGVLSGPEDTEASCTQTWSPGITSGAPSFPTPHLLPVPSQPDALGAGGRNPEMHVQLFFSPFPTPGPCKAGSASFFSFLNLRLASLSPGLSPSGNHPPAPHLCCASAPRKIFTGRDARGARERPLEKTAWVPPQARPPGLGSTP